MVSPKKKPAVKKSVKKSPSKSRTKPQYRTLQKSKEQSPFLTFKLTQQTAYWTVFAIVILFFGIYLIYINAKIQDIYNEIDINSSAIDTYIEEPAKKPSNN